MMIDNFLELAAALIADSMEDIDFFYILMDNPDIHLGFRFDFDANDKVFDYTFFPFDIISEDGEIELGFAIAIANDELEEQVSRDAYYIDLASSIDVSVDDGNLDDALDILDNVSGFYVDPIRPFSWVISKRAFNEDTTVEEAAEHVITSLRSFFAMEFAELPPKKPSHLKLIAKDGNIIK